MPTILYSENDHIGLLTVNRPEALNALNRQTLAELEAALDKAAQNPPRCLLVTGAGEKAFVAGADIGEMLPLNEAESAAFSALGMRVMDKLESFPCPAIAVVNGFALGGGCELALACDIRLACDSASFAFPEVGLGIPPGFGGMQRAVRAVGPGMAKQLIYTAQRVNANAALDMGLVNAVFPAADLMNKAMELARRIAANAPLAVRAAKAAINGAAALGLSEAAQSETPHFASCFGSADQRAAMGAFLEKRKPDPFIGR